MVDNSALLALADRIEEAKGRCISIDTQAASELRSLYEQNKELLDALKQLVDDNHPEYIPSRLWKKAHAAIAKATGEKHE